MIRLTSAICSLAALFAICYLPSAIAANPTLPDTGLNRVHATVGGQIQITGGSTLTFENNTNRAAFAAELAVSGGLAGVGSIGGLTGIVTLDQLQNIGLMRMATPQQYGAVNSGTSHPVSEWLTGGANPRGYANLAAIQADYPHVTSLSDESDWAAWQQAENKNQTVFLPAGTSSASGYVINHPIEFQNDGQQIIGGGRQGPYGTIQGVRVLVGPGIDGIRSSSFHACSVRDLSVFGSSVTLASVVSASHTAQAVMTTSSAHGLSSASVTITSVSSGTTTSSDPTVSSTITTATNHGLTNADWILISGNSTSGLNGMWRVRVLTPTTFKILDTNQSEVGVAAGTGGQFVRVYEVAVGPLGTVMGSVGDPLVGVYHVVATGTTTLNLYDESNTPVVLSTDAIANRGTLYTSRHLVHFGSGQDFDNTQNSTDPAHSWNLANVFAEYAMTGFYLGNSDAGGSDHLVGYNLGIGIFDDGSLDRSGQSHGWMTGCMRAGFRVARNGGITLDATGGANNRFHVELLNGGSSITSTGSYFEGIPGVGDDSYVELGANNQATFVGLQIQDGGAGHNIFHAQANSRLTVHGSSPGLTAWQQGSSHIFADAESNVIVNYNGSTSTTGTIFYTAGDFDYYTSDNTFTLTQNVGGVAQSGTVSTLTVDDATVLYVGNSITVSGASGGNNGTFTIASMVDNTHITFTNASGVNQGAAGTVRRNGSIAQPVQSDVGKQVVIAPGSGSTPSGHYQVYDMGSGNIAYFRTGFDVLPPQRGGTGLTSFSVGDIPYATDKFSLGKIAKGTDGQVLLINPTTHLPTFGDAPGSVNAFTVSSSANHNLGFTTLANVPDLTISSVPTGTYTVKVRGVISFGPGGDAGWKWDLNGGTAAFSSHQTRYSNITNIPEAGTGMQAYQMTPGSTFGPTGQAATVSGNIYDGEDWTTTSGGGAGDFIFDYSGSLTVTSSGSVIFRQANHSGSGDTGTLGQCQITLIKQ